MKKFSPILFLAVLAVLLTGCDLKKMVKKHDTVKYEAKPEVLEVHGGVVKVEVKGNFPPKYFGKRVNVVFQPELQYEGGSMPLKKINISGEKITTGDGTVINKKAGGSFSYTDQFIYKPEMMASELHVDVKATRKKKTVNLGDVKLADGIIITSLRVSLNDDDTEIAAHGYEKVVVVTQKANLYFDYNSSNLTMSQKLNKMQQNIDAINTLKSFIEQGWEIKDIQINAWASPEGELSLNTKLSEDRGKVGQKWLVDYMNELDRKKAREMKVKVDQIKRNYTLNVNAKGEDYDGFMASMQASNIPEKQSIINVIKMQPNKTQREQEIKNMTVIYAEVEAILEPLRRSEIVVNCFEPKKTDEQIAQLAVSDPSKLDEKELLYAATLTDDMETQLKIYRTATTQFPNSWKGFNNAGSILLEMGNTTEAVSYIEKADALSPNNPQVLKNHGVIATRNKDTKNAMVRYEKAKQSGSNVNYNMAILKIMNGEYEEALKLMGSASCRYNLALAQVLSGKSAEAVKTLDCMKVKTAEGHYLMAIIGARTGNTSMMNDNLKKAIAMDPKYKAEAKKDREFLKYFNNSDFQNAIK
jgi:tetratricopeptide (TPR) repeat protein